MDSLLGTQITVFHDVAISGKGWQQMRITPNVGKIILSELNHLCLEGLDYLIVLWDILIAELNSLLLFHNNKRSKKIMLEHSQSGHKSCRTIHGNFRIWSDMITPTTFLSLVIKIILRFCNHKLKKKKKMWLNCSEAITSIRAWRQHEALTQNGMWTPRPTESSQYHPSRGLRDRRMMNSSRISLILG